MSSGKRSFRHRNFKHDYCIYNPTIEPFATLPPPGGRIHRGANLAYEKITSLLGHWFQQETLFIDVNVQFRGGVFGNGAIQWTDYHGTCLYFNVDEVQLREMPMLPTPVYPAGWEEGRTFRYFRESREHLHLVEIYGPCTIKFGVYEMERDYAGWFVKYHVDLNAITITFPGMIRSYLDPSGSNYYAFSTPTTVREANDAESYMLLHIPGKATRYKLNDRKFNEICDFDPGRENIEGPHFAGSLKWFYGFQYIETLACV